MKDVQSNCCGRGCGSCEETTERQLEELPFSQALNFEPGEEGEDVGNPGSNEDEWEVETLPIIPWNELGGES